MSTALFLSPILPADFLVRGSGVHHRFQLMLEGVRQIADAIDFVIMVDASRAGALDAPTRESFEVLSRLVDVPISVTLVPIEAPHPDATLFGKYVRSSTSFFRLPGFRPYIGPRQVAAITAALDRQPGFILAHRLVSVALLLRALGQRPVPPVFVDLDDIEHIAYRRSIAQAPVWPSKRLAYLHLPALLYGEYRALRLCQKLFVCSEVDRDYLAHLFRTSKIEAVPNAVRIPPEQLPARAPHLLFLGIFSYPPNRAAAEFFLDTIWPQIRAAVPNARAVIAGARPEVISRYENPPPGVEFPGFVPELDALYAATRIVVSPILAGGGTRVKIIEAAAYGKPVVSTPLGAEGLAFCDGEDILLRKDPAAFAAACVGLLQDYESCLRLGRAARLRAENTYTRDRTASRLSMIMRSALESRAGLQKRTERPDTESD